MNKTFVAVILAALSVSPAMADPFTAGHLSDYCESQNPWEIGVCYGYSFAVTDSLIRSGTICVPDGVNMKQIGKIVGAYLARNPEFHHQGPLSSVTVALMKAFLCPATPPLPSAKPSTPMTP